MQTYYSFDEARTTAIAHELAARLHAGDIVLLRGDLGAGKSVFARGLARAWGVEGHVTSPTFTTMQQYDGARSRATCPRTSASDLRMRTATATRA